MKIVVALLSLMVLAGCEQSNGAKGITYFKDSGTALCFAQQGYGKRYSFTMVPCSPSVEMKIRQNR